MVTPKTLFDKIWDSHVVTQETGSPAVLYIDLHLIHEVTSPQAFEGLHSRGLPVRRPGKILATIDHSVPTLGSSKPASRLAYADPSGAAQIHRLEDNCRDFGVELNGLDSPRQGIVHVIGPELGWTQPGMTIVCGDSHTATHGAFGALAFGIGTSEVEHVLATQCLLQQRPKTYEVRLEGRLPKGVAAKDVILAVIHKMGVGGGAGSVLEYTGSAVRTMSMEQRMTVCNMSIEAGARAGMVAPDDTTFQYLAGKEFAPKGRAWDESLARWRSLPSDAGAVYDNRLTLDVTDLSPRVTFGTNPGMSIPVDGLIPILEEIQDPNQRTALEHSLTYMDLRPGTALAGHPIDVVFIGSCTNGRLSDLVAAADMMRGRKIAPGIRILVVAGSQKVKAEAEALGLDQVFKEAGAEWREPGCSMCIAMNGDELAAGQYSVSTSNRNFEGRQGKGSRTFLASPLTAAAAALTGRITDPRSLMK
jgi:3-isopropylmalate/(R)-2-methylmalate dehydratase large subunit